MHCIDDVFEKWQEEVWLEEKNRDKRITDEFREETVKGLLGPHKEVGFTLGGMEIHGGMGSCDRVCDFTDGFDLCVESRCREAEVRIPVGRLLK